MEEINRIVKDISETADKYGYEEAYKKGDKIIKEYPSCDRLILYVAQVLNLYIRTLEVKNKEKYEMQITAWYELLVSSKEKEISSMATAALVSKHMEKQEYEKAQELLDKIPPLGYDKRISQAVLFSRQGKNSEAYEIYEGMLLKASNEICSVIHLVTDMLCKEERYEEAERYVDIGETVAEIFDLGAYTKCITQLFLAIEKKDKEKSLEMIEKMINELESMTDFQKSPLYSHMKFKKQSNLEPMKKLLKKSFKSDSQLDFIKDEPRFKNIMEKLDK